jgi:hypothetical protein
MDPDAAELAWRQWSTYVGAENAIERRDKLAGKGYRARVVDTDTGKIVQDAPAPRCHMCTENHSGPYDGSCLL